MGHQVNLTTLTFDAWSANGSDPRTVFVRYSTDNFATFTQVIGPTVAPASDSPPTMAVGNIGLGGLTSTIEFRMYGYNHTGTDRADRALQYDNIVLNGTVMSVPEPGSLARTARARPRRPWSSCPTPQALSVCTPDPPKNPAPRRVFSRRAPARDGRRLRCRHCALPDFTYLTIYMT